MQKLFLGLMTLAALSVSLEAAEVARFEKAEFTVQDITKGTRTYVGTYGRELDATADKVAVSGFVTLCRNAMAVDVLNGNLAEKVDAEAKAGVKFEGKKVTVIFAHEGFKKSGEPAVRSVTANRKAEPTQFVWVFHSTAPAPGRYNDPTSAGFGFRRALVETMANFVRSYTGHKSGVMVWNFNGTTRLTMNAKLVQ